MRPKRYRFTSLLGGVLLAALAACGSSSDDANGSGDTTAGESTADATTAAETATTAASTAAGSGEAATFPVTIDAANGEVSLEAQPGAIVSLSPTATEMLFAIGAGPQVTAVDDQSNYPAEAPVTDLSGFEPNVEAIAAKQPDLVVVADDTAGLTESLGQLGIPVLSLPAATKFDDVYTQIEQLGVATGNVGGATELVGQMQADIAAIVDGLPEQPRPLTYYHELDNTLFSATSDTFIGQVYALLGLQNIADAADQQGSGYPQLSQEFVIQSNPDLVFLADTICCGQSADTVAARPGWDQLNAVQNGHVIPLSDDVASRWGPRIVDYLAEVAAAMEAVQPATTG